ncbi:CheR family methyltransferase [Desulfobacter vibrioformis]|uniref:CheR family methyltransferase n=1 Tax=Desulfobacter vibrioformis TaxID=34031 RepID=UPI00054F5A7B|nr:protein-glutamate O-methyltransferase CheR [Desulfobacter vibrioformis]
MNSIRFKPSELTELKTLVYKTCGINLHEGKLELLKSKVAKRMRLTQMNVQEYLSHLRSNEREVIEFIDAITTNHSFFYRENKSIEYIVKQFGCHPKRERKHFKIWSAACSTGDEPYTAAVQLKALGLAFSILATDISHSVLEIAQKGIYINDKVKQVPLPILHRYFQKGTGKYRSYLKVKKEIQQHITFKKFNLISDPIPRSDFDAVLCRNVMIYFNNQTSEAIVNKLYQSLCTDGFFAIGNAESLMSMKHPFKSVAGIPSLYVK